MVRTSRRGPAASRFTVEELVTDKVTAGLRALLADGAWHGGLELSALAGTCAIPPEHACGAARDYLRVPRTTALSDQVRRGQRFITEAALAALAQQGQIDSRTVDGPLEWRWCHQRQGEQRPTGEGVTWTRVDELKAKSMALDSYRRALTRIKQQYGTEEELGALHARAEQFRPGNRKGSLHNRLYQLIRDFYASHPDASAKDVLAYLDERAGPGSVVVEVTPQDDGDWNITWLDANGDPRTPWRWRTIEKKLARLKQRARREQCAPVKELAYLKDLARKFAPPA